MIALAFVLLAQTGPTTETWNLHKYGQLIGKETATLQTQGEATLVSTDFAFTDRSSPVKLSASMRLAQDGSVLESKVKGQTSRMSGIDRQITVSGAGATAVELGQTRTIPVPAKYVVSSGYSPLVGQEAMLRYWNSHGKPSKVANLPSGEIRISPRGTDEVKVAGRSIRLNRYGVDGVMWGQEILWTDPAGRLVAGVMCDAEFDHFEALTPEYEPLLDTFIHRAAEDQMKRLTDLAAKLSPRRAKATALIGGRLIDGTGKAPLENATVVIRDGRIVAAGPAGTVTVPADAERIDVEGKTILPGLWDMHAHYNQVEWGPIYLASGVTTVRDCGNEFDFEVPVRDAIDAGQGIGPRLLLAGLVDGTSPMALGTVRVDNVEQVRAAVARYKKAGFRQIKIYSSVKPEMVKAVCEEAHRAGLTVTGHIPEGMDLKQGVELGMDQVNHFQYVLSLIGGKGAFMKPVDRSSPAAKDVIEFMRKHGTVMDDTMVLFALFMHEPAAKEEFEPGLAKLAPELRTALNSFVTNGSTAGGKLLDSWLALLGEMHRAGIPIVAGTDQSIPGFSLHKELELYVRAGFTPIEAIQAATSVPARVMGLDREVGTLTPGKRADVLVVDGDPSRDIRDTRKVWLVLANGRPYRPAPLWQSVGFLP